MEVTKYNRMLCNYEVYQVLKEQDQIHKGLQQENVRTIEREALEYFQTNDPVMKQSVTAVEGFMQDVAKYKLTKAEKLQLLNARPHAVVHLYMIIEECEHRFNAQERVELLQIVRLHLGSPPPPLEDEDEGEATQ